MFDLLKKIRNAIRHMDIHILSLLVNGGFITIQRKGLPGMDQCRQQGIMRLGTDIKITRIKPATHIQTRYVLTRFKGRIRFRTLCIKIEMLMIYRGLQRIVHVRGPMPYTIRLIHKHMVHLHGQKNILCKMPCLFIYVFSYPERLCPFMAKFNDIQAFLFNRTEIKFTV